jgi:hypothetical protein
MFGPLPKAMESNQKTRKREQDGLAIFLAIHNAAREHSIASSISSIIMQRSET